MVIILYIFCFLLKITNTAPERCNLFNPYEWLFDKARFDIFPIDHEQGMKLSTTVRLEQSICIDGYTIDEYNRIDSSNRWRHKVNPLHYLEREENIFASFLGNKKSSEYQTIVNQYTKTSGNTTNTIISMEGSVDCTACNIALEAYMTQEVRLGFYVPCYRISLHDLKINTPSQKNFFEEYNNKSLKALFEHYGFQLTNNTRYGWGDSLLLLSYQDSLTEKRDFITGITYGSRIGFSLPTRSNQQEEDDRIIQIPLGHDASWGIAFGGSLEVDLGKYCGLGLSADCIKLFGVMKERRIKTDMQQNSILLLTKELSYIDPGFQESFTLYIAGHDSEKKYTGTLAYQYYKQNDSEIIICSDYFSNAVANTMERLEPWTTHNLIGTFSRRYDISESTDGIGSLFIKYGFNGSRSLVATTVGFELGIVF